MKHANTGLYEFCKQLGRALIRNKDRQPSEELCFYVPPALKGFFGGQWQYIIQHELHKFMMPSQRDIDIWHMGYQLSPYRPGSHRTRKVLTIHDLNFIHEKKAPHKIKRYLKQVQRNIDQADHIVTISNFVMQDVRQHLQLRDKQASVVMNGCDLEAYPDFDAPVYRPGRPFIFAIGTINAKKNFHVLPCLLQGNDYEMVLAGSLVDESYKQKILAEARKHGVLERVKILGPVSYPDKYWYLSHCAAFLFPSLAEGLGFPVVEAMSLGKACFISDRTSLPEVGGDCAYYFHDFDPACMQQVFREGMQDYISRQRWDAIMQRGRSFTFDNTSTGYLEVYRSLY